MMADTGVVEFPGTPTIGITYDTRDDFKFTSDDPWDWDAEFEVSVAIDDITNAIEDLGFPTVIIGSAEKLLEGFLTYRQKVQMVFNIAEGKLGRSREAQVPSILEAGGIAYVGSDAETLAIALNKAQTKYNAVAHHIRTPEFAVISDIAEIRSDEIPEYPVILKLTHGGSSMGLDERSKIYNFGQLKRHARYLLRTYRQDVLAERFIEGPEYDVPILGTNPDDVFGVVEVTLNGKPMGKNHLTSKIIYKDGYGLDVAPRRRRLFRMQEDGPGSVQLAAVQGFRQGRHKNRRGYRQTVFPRDKPVSVPWHAQQLQLHSKESWNGIQGRCGSHAR